MIQFDKHIFATGLKPPPQLEKMTSNSELIMPKIE